MELTNYIGYTCDSCGNSFELDLRAAPPTPQCPSCYMPVQMPDVQMIVGDFDVESGLYECYACGHTFSYAATVQENPDEEPNCPVCTSPNTGLIY